ncbi:MAG: T9SS type A sorting domain-containing protein [Flavobacteriales bacterium]|nr:T9SS type A sorting domain-containing protein [Flavobacteriales bacterium]
MTRSLFASMAIFLSTFTWAQLPMVDIALADNGAGELEVRVRPDGDFDEFFASIVFTIRWDAASGANLDQIAQAAPVSFYMPVIKSGPETDAGGYRYQIFAGFGTNALSAFGESWTAGNEILLMTIPVVNGTSLFEIVNDSWTGDVNNNGDFYVSLNGQDQTGIIYQLSTGVRVEGAPGAGFSAHPNPSAGPVVLDLNIPEDVRSAVVEWHDASGRVVRTDRITGRGAVRFAVDVTGLERGTYMARLTCDGVMSTERVVLR